MTALSVTDETAAAESYIRSVLPVDAWFDNPAAGTNGVLDALFGPSQKYRGQYAPKRPKKPFVSRVYRYPMPEGPAGAEYRAAVRAWGRGQGYTVKTCGLPEGWLLNAYVEATGNVWNAAEEQVAA